MRCWFFDRPKSVRSMRFGRLRAGGEQARLLATLGTANAGLCPEKAGGRIHAGAGCRIGKLSPAVSVGGKNERGGVVAHFHIDSIKAAATQKTTTTRGGTFQRVNKQNPIAATTKSILVTTALVHTGEYSAAPSKPTTAAFVPLRTAVSGALARSRCQ